MADSIKVDSLAAELAKALTEYSEDLTESVKKAALEESQEAAKVLKQNSPILTGSYAKGWIQRKTFEGKYSSTHVAYNKTDSQLTHLLEYGHVKRNGGRVAAIPHIKPVETQAIENFKRKVESAANGNS